MRFKGQTFLLAAAACLFAFSTQAQAQCTSCNQGASFGGPIAQDVSFAAPVNAGPIHGGKSCGCRGGGVDGCKPTAPTVPPILPNLPIQTACGSPLGISHVPKLLTPIRSYTPPIGKAVGRPLIGRWDGW